MNADGMKEKDDDLKIDLALIYGLFLLYGEEHTPIEGDEPNMKPPARTKEPIGRRAIRY